MRTKKIPFIVFMAMIVFLLSLGQPALADDVYMDNSFNAGVIDSQVSDGSPGLLNGGAIGGFGNVNFSGSGQATDPTDVTVEGAGIGAYNAAAQTGLTIPADPPNGILAQIGNMGSAGMDFSEMRERAIGTTANMNLNAQIDVQSYANIGTPTTSQNYVVTTSNTTLNCQLVRNTSGQIIFPNGLRVTNESYSWENSNLADPTLKNGFSRLDFRGPATGFDPAPLSTYDLNSTLTVTTQAFKVGTFGLTQATNNGTININSWPTGANTGKTADLTGGSLTQVAETITPNSITVNVQAQSGGSGSISNVP